MGSVPWLRRIFRGFLGWGGWGVGWFLVRDGGVDGCFFRDIYIYIYIYFFFFSFFGFWGVAIIFLKEFLIEVEFEVENSDLKRS